MRGTAPAIVLFALGACGPEPVVPGSFKFVEVPGATSGFDFVHGIRGELDDTIKAATGGLALVDYDGDGKVDIFCSNGGTDDLAPSGALQPAKPLKCRLYRNLGGMRFEDVTEKAGVEFAGMAFGACVGDFDGDARPDLFVPAYGVPVLYRNCGDRTFEDVAVKAGLTPGFYAGSTFLDYDRDGVVDLFTSQYLDLTSVDAALNKPGQFLAPTAYPALPARLWHGRGDGTFEDVTAKARIGTPGKGMGVLATDIDGDGWIDLFVANDGMPNFVWRNLGDGTFVNSAVKLGMAYGADGEPRASMGITGADLNGDGRFEYLTPDTRGGAVYVARDRHFTDRAKDWGFTAMTFGFIGWTDVVLDAENDGLPDVWKVHGDLNKAALADGQWPTLMSNRGRHERAAVSFEYNPPSIVTGAMSEFAVAAQVRVTGRGGLASDLDDDGREDLVVIDLVGEARLLHNITEKAGNWIRVRLVGKGANTMALGARLTAHVGRRPVIREVTSSTGYISAPDPRLFFGLGREDALEDVVVHWPNGKEQRVGSLAAGRDHVVSEE